MIYEIAIALGYPHPDHWLRQISGRQLSQMLAFYRRRPFGESMQDLRVGTQLAQYHNSQLDKKSRHKAKKPTDFIWWRGKMEKAKQTPADLKRKIEAAFGIGRPNG